MPVNNKQRAMAAPTPELSRRQKRRKAKPQLVGWSPAQEANLQKQLQANENPKKKKAVQQSSHSEGGAMALMAPQVKGRSLAALVKAKDAGSVATLTMLPEQGSFHYSGTYTAAPMVLARPFAVSDFNFAPDAGASPPDVNAPFTLGSTMVFLRRSVLQMTIRYIRNDAATAWSAHSRRFASGAETPYQNLLSGGQIPLDITHFADLATAQFLPPKQWNPTYGDPGVGEFRAMFVNGTPGRATTLTLNRAIVAPLPWEIKLYKLRGTEWEISQSPVWAAATTFHDLSITDSAYYAVVLVTPEFGTGEIYALLTAISGTSGVWRIEPMPGFDDHYATVQNVRINAASLLLSPNCALDERSGRVECVQLPSGAAWHSAARTNHLGANPQSVSMSFVKGSFGYIKPSADTSYALRNVVHRDDDGLIASIQEDLFCGVDTIAFGLTVPISSSVVAYPAANIHVTTVAAIEYATDTTWSEAGVPAVTPQDFSRALAVIRDLPQFFENETHGEAILRFLRAGVNGVIKYGPAVMNIAAIIASLL